jgi:HAD superfamily hydrolase (TIGR01509 family)
MNSGALRPGVLFDVDGTLLDTNYLHTLAWARAFRDADEWAPMNAIHRLIGMGSDQLVQVLLGHPNAAASDARAARYRELMSEARAFPGAVDLLRRTRAAGLAVVLATSSPATELEAMLDTLRGHDAIDAQTNADDVHASKPDPELMRTAMTVGGVDPERALAVGDSVWDIEAARAAGIGCVAVETGGFSHHELSEAGAVRVYHDVQELVRQFQTSPLAALAR